MGRKKKKPTKPWCWYCNREFDDEKILIQHQKAKHYKCHVCHKKLYTGPGLAIHCMQVHKEMIDKIPNGLPNRNSVDIEIYGMQGIPEEDIRDHDRNRGNESTPFIPSLPNKPTSGLLPLSSPLPSIHIPFPGMPLLPPLPPGAPPPIHGAPPIPGGHFPAHPPPAISINLPRKPLFPSASAIIAGQSTTSGLTSSISGLGGSSSSLGGSISGLGGSSSGLNSSSSSAILSAPASISKPSTTTSTSGGPPPPLPSSSSSSSVPSLPPPSGSISTGNPMSRIVHPGEDISLEELRARRPKYQSVKSEESRIQQSAGPSAGQLPPMSHMPPGHHFPQTLPTGPPPGFHFPPPGFNGQLPAGPPPTLPPVGRRWDAPPPAQPTFASTFKPAY